MFGAMALEASLSCSSFPPRLRSQRLLTPISVANGIVDSLSILVMSNLRTAAGRDSETLQN
jgi:hypothetical protein